VRGMWWAERARRDDVSGAWTAEILATLACRIDGSRQLSLSGYTMSLDRLLADHLDAALCKLEVDVESPSRRARQELRSSTAEVALERWLLAPRHGRHAQSVEVGSITLPTAAMFGQRLDPRQRNSLHHSVFFLPSSLIERLDAHLATVVSEALGPEHRAWASDARDDLRSAIVEAALRAWLIAQGIEVPLPQDPVRVSRLRRQRRPCRRP
jgi:hypothetical protein